jgi:Kef-type K+ transport system membrane component KefB
MEEHMPEFESVFQQIGAVLAVCVAAGVLATLLRQPLIVGLLAAGLAVGPDALGLVGESSEIELLAEIGISLLLFVVGLKLDVRLVRKLGPVALATGVGQIVFTSAFGFLIARVLGFDTVAAVYIAVALTFSSTIIIVKLLTDKGELDDLHGRIALGFLIVQDIGVVLAMIAITAVGDGSGDLAGEFLGAVVRGVGLLIFVVLMARHVLPRAIHLLARQAELLVLAAVTWAVAMAGIAVVLGFSEEVGAFLAGMSLASSSYREAISGRLTTLRDFLLVFFFIDLGTQFELSAAGSQLGAALVFSLFVLIGNPAIVMAIMGLLGYRKKVSFKAGLTVAQISEFSLILVALGVSLGQVDSEVVGLVTAVGLITISASTYMISGSDTLYRWTEPALRIFERARPTATIDLDDGRPRPEFIVIGLGRFGRTVLDELHDRGDVVLGVDYDPRSVEAEDAQTDVERPPVLYGDAEDPHLPESLPLEGTRWVISTLRSVDANRQVISALRRHGFAGRIAVSADQPEEEQLLLGHGADIALRPLHVAAGPLLARIHEAG